MIIDNVHQLPGIGIGQATRIYGLTARAIRFYEEKGLVTPRRDRTNARIYDGQARQRLAWIAQLRKVGLSLEDIGEILEAEESGRGTERAIACMQSLRESLRQNLERVENRLAELSVGRPRTAGLQSG